MSESIKLVTSDTFSLAFEGENQIEAALLGAALSNTAFIINTALSTDASHPNLQLKVSTFEKGSFAVTFQAILTVANQISTLYSIQDAAAVFDILKGIFDIKRALKGQRPKAITPNEAEGFIHVEAPDGSTVTAPLGSQVVILNRKVEQKVSEIGGIARLHNPNGGFRLESGSDVAYYDREAVDDIAVPVDISAPVPYEKRRQIQAVLPIRKIDLLGDTAWSFRYGNRTIMAKIEDENFLISVHKGLTAYKAGDRLRVDMTIKENYDADDTLTSITYIINQVLEVMPAPN